MTHFTEAPIFDADQHMYETPDSLTKYLPEKYSRGRSIRPDRQADPDRHQQQGPRLHPEPDVRTRRGARRT
jgi:hypothetical protein